MAAASVDDIFVIVLFTVFTSLGMDDSISPLNFLQIPTSIILGIIVGVIVGLLLTKLFGKFRIRDTNKIIIILSVSFLLLELEESLKGIIAISALLSIMVLGIIIARKNLKLADRLSSKYNKLWLGAEILLFVLVGATVDLNYAFKAGLPTIFIVFLALTSRMIGVYVSLLKTKFTKKEKLFCIIAYTPKATVQAAIGAIPLTMGLACGQDVLIVSVLSILITAPFGDIGIDRLYNRFFANQTPYFIFNISGYMVGIF